MTSFSRKVRRAGAKKVGSIRGWRAPLPKEKTPPVPPSNTFVNKIEEDGKIYYVFRSKDGDLFKVPAFGGPDDCLHCKQPTKDRCVDCKIALCAGHRDHKEETRCYPCRGKQ